ncbi:MAG: SPOR domain-containing protein [Treponema sp.]|jgi:hypothetical protein|nr:SPOR domain-containing protein [Treponema sp.]
MKERKTKKRLLTLLCAAAMAFTGASIWEGAVTTAPRGALPDEGYYVATNSFPRNTVVDITNLETDKTVRVIVSSGLDTPGLLATLSEDAAKSIGLQARSIGRIRMTQPSDPIAFSRFTEGLAGSGDPDYDPEAMIKAEEEDAEEEAGLTLTPLPRQPVADEPPVSSGNEEDYFGGIVDVPGPEEPEQYEEEFPEDGERALAGLDDEEDSPEKTLYPIWAQGGSVGTPVSPEPAPEPVIAGPPASPPPPPPPDPGQGQAQVSAQTTIPAPAAGEVPAQVTTTAEGPAGWASAWVTAPQDRAEPPAPGAYDYSLVPAEQRPPTDPGVYTIPPEAQIGPMVQVPPAQAPRKAEPVIDESLFIESIEDMRQRNAPSPAPALNGGPEVSPSPVIPRETLPEPRLAEPSPPEPALPEPVIIVEEPSLPENAPASKAAPLPKATPRPGTDFSIPLIGELEKGKYYLQLGAYSKPDALESSAAKLDGNYPLAVQAAGSPDNPVYRLLLGPVNLGESGALLQRFKGSGYSDAFVRTY